MVQPRVRIFLKLLIWWCQTTRVSINAPYEVRAMIGTGHEFAVLRKSVDCTIMQGIVYQEAQRRKLLKGKE